MAYIGKVSIEGVSELHWLMHMQRQIQLTHTYSKIFGLFWPHNKCVDQHTCNVYNVQLSIFCSLLILSTNMYVYVQYIKRGVKTTPRPSHPTYFNVHPSPLQLIWCMKFLDSPLTYTCNHLGYEVLLCWTCVIYNTCIQLFNKQRRSWNTSKRNAETDLVDGKGVSPPGFFLPSYL